jgi:hypothetical protein
VMDTLDFLVRFWELRARYERLGVPLTQSERVELLSLLQLIAAEGLMSEMEQPGSARHRVPVQLTAGSGFLSGDLTELTADRLVIGAAEPIDAGTRTIVYVADAVSGIEYSLPCTVLWSRDDEPCLMGLVIDGIPSRSQFTVPVSGLWRSPLGHVSGRVEA